MGGKQDKWKEALLRSGVPLEISVAQALSGREWFVHDELSFTVVRPDKSTVVRSVDIHAWWSSPVAELRVLAECKYRRDGIKWFFVGNPCAQLDRTAWVTSCLVGPFVPPWYYDGPCVFPPVVYFAHRPRNPNDLLLPVVRKGVEIIPGDQGSDKVAKSSDESRIKTALYQVRYGVAAVQYGFPPLAKEELDSYVSSHHFHFTIPMVVTTAELFILKDQIGVKEVRGAQDIEEIAERSPALIVRGNLDRELRTYNQLLLEENCQRLLNSQPKGQSAEAWRSQMFSRPGGTQSSFAEMQCRNGADRVLIVNWGSFAEIMGEIRRLFNDVDALEPDALTRRGHYHGLVYNIRSRHSRLAPLQAEQ
ncbi:MAG TPA: hypothetical protein VMZ31_00600 [Phycisphaerae bacterium]|nr:hypothetical protein [Phycisphaerae bacterium]